MSEYLSSLRSEAMARKNINEDGATVWLYLVRIPPNRIKIGYAEDVEKRFEDAKIYTFIPDLEILGSWKIRQHWESYAREYATDGLEGLKPLFRAKSQSEVFQYERGEYDAIIGEIKRRLSVWIEIHADVYPLKDADKDATENVVPLEKREEQ